MSVPSIYPGLTFHDLEMGMLIVFLRPKEGDPRIWVTLIMDQEGGYDILWESSYTVQHLLDRLDSSPQIERVC